MIKEPEWLYSWNWTELVEYRLSGAANDLDKLANELSALAATCWERGKNSLSIDMVTDAGVHYEDELNCWKQNIDSEVVANLKISASAIRNTIAERQTIWDQFQDEVRKYMESTQKEDLTE